MSFPLFRWYNFSKKHYPNYRIIKVTLKSYIQTSSVIMPLLFWVMWGLCRMMYAEINFSGCVCVWQGVDFQSDPSSVSYVQKSSSLELDTIGHQYGPLKYRFPSLILPPSATVSKNVPPYLVQGLIRDPFSAKAENKHT